MAAPGQLALREQQAQVEQLVLMVLLVLLVPQAQLALRVT
jgi:hypothetical protein